MIKGKIKSINSGDTGTILQNGSDKEIAFSQPGITSMELKENYEVSYNLVTLDDGTTTATNLIPNRKALVNNIRLGEKGVYTGEISDLVTKEKYTFQSVYSKHAIPKEGSEVCFDLIRTNDCKLLAINVELS